MGGGFNANPEVNATNISIAEFDGSDNVVNLLANVTGNNLVVSRVTLADGSVLPDNFSFDDENLTIMAFDVADGVNQSYDLNVTVSDGDMNVSYMINYTVQDMINDAMLSMSDIIIADSTIALGDDLNLSIEVSDTDGVVFVDYSLYLLSDDGGVLVDSGALTDIGNDIYNLAVTSDILVEGNYSIVVNALGIIGGETPSSEGNKTDSFSVLADAVTVIEIPTLDAKSDLTISTTIGDFSDSDGIRDVTVSLFYDDALVNLFATNTSGDFLNLTADTTYYIVTSGEALNAETNEWESKVSQVLVVTTDLTLDALTIIYAPTYVDRGTSSIKVNIGTFVDDDGVKNTTIRLYANSSLTTLVNTSPTGYFTGLYSSRSYYAVTVGEALNGETGVWQEKTSQYLIVMTSTPPPPPPPPPPANTPPTATDATADMAFDESEQVTYNLASHIADAEDADNALIITIVTNPTKGSLSWSGTSFTFTATPASGVFGDDSFTYKVTDSGGLSSAVRTVTITNISEDGGL